MANEIVPIIEAEILPQQNIENLIYNIRGVPVMLDRDLSMLYNVETKYLNRQVKRNPTRFPEDFMFQLTKEEWNMIKQHVITSHQNWKCQNVTSNSEDEFTQWVKKRLGIFFDGQMFEAYVLVETLFRKATRRIVLIDDYVNGDILQRMRVKSSTAVTIDCYVQHRHQTPDMQLAFQQYNVQYPSEHCQLHTFERSHDRFLIIDDEVYHFGASIKDLGKRWFGVNLITEHTADELIARL